MVACFNSNGAPDFFHCIVNCSEEEYKSGEHYTAANIKAEDKGYSEPFIGFSEKDSAGYMLLPLFPWRKAPEVDVSIVHALDFPKMFNRIDS